MRITVVKYSRLVSGPPGSYGNQTVGAEATVPEDQLPEHVLDKLRTWVNCELELPTQEPIIRERIAQLEAQKVALAESVGRLQSLWFEALKLLKAHGVVVKEEFPTVERSLGIGDIMEADRRVQEVIHKAIRDEAQRIDDLIMGKSGQGQEGL